jgi:hypothetical protein
MYVRMAFASRRERLLRRVAFVKRGVGSASMREMVKMRLWRQ